MRIMLFDIDGTLLLSGGAGLRSIRRVFGERFGVPIVTEGMKVHGLTDLIILQSIATRSLGRELPEDELAVVCDEYVTALVEELETGDGFRLLPGAREVVSALARRGDTLLGLATGNIERGAYAKLRRGRLDGFFAFGGFGSDSADRAELTRLAVERGRERAGPETPALVIGDTTHDVRAALAAGAECLGVATGISSEDELRKAGARWSVPDLAHRSVSALLGLD
jgi:phosphoglycolate phosphatase-like HAD superfamily hydrolase